MQKYQPFSRLNTRAYSELQTYQINQKREGIKQILISLIAIEDFVDLRQSYIDVKIKAV